MFVLWLLFDILAQVIFEAFFSLFRALDEDEGAWPLAVLLFLVVGLFVGGITSWVVPERVMRPGPFLGVSLVVVPALLAGFMEFWGRVIGGRGRRTSHLATWYGGAAMGLGMAAGRLTIMHLGRAGA